MVSVKLYEHQKKAIDKMRTGSILCGGVGSGKSRTAIAYYCKHVCGCKVEETDVASFFDVECMKSKDLYIITTPKKRDTLEWKDELEGFDLTITGTDANKHPTIVVDSWNNIRKYAAVRDAFFVFDEQRAVGYGSWARMFISIARKNDWVMLSATPGDTWMDYCSVFIANGFYKNKTDFLRQHVVFSRFTKYPKVERYLDTQRLAKLRGSILVTMDFDRTTVRHHEYVDVGFNEVVYEDVKKRRWNIYSSSPAKDAGELCRVFQRIVNSDSRRTDAVLRIFEDKKRIIVFYNYDYERELLKRLAKKNKIPFGEWSGHGHDQIPRTDKWIFIVQYTAGAEGWNCIDTDTIVFYSQSYSYKATVQAAGRIDRLNTPYKNLYYYHLVSSSSIDKAIRRCLSRKKDFNAKAFMKNELIF